MHTLLLVAGLFFTALTGPAVAEEFRGARIEPEVEADYDRERDYGNWTDADQDCQSTRVEVLIAESHVPVTLNDDGCRIIAGLWFDPYGEDWFTAPAIGRRIFIDIDHMVPLLEAHQSGAHAWTQERREAYANDLTNPGHLIAVSSSLNRSKSDRDPAEWLPPNRDYWCTYALTWLAVKREWDLTMDQAEADTLRDILDLCPETE